jgi:hypothetical protein
MDVNQCTSDLPGDLVEAVLRKPYHSDAPPGPIATPTTKHG